MKTVKIAFCKVELENEAQEAEIWLADCLRQANCYPGARRIEHVQAGILQVINNLDIEKNADKVYVNINPIRYLIDNGEKKLAMTMANNKYLPISYEGLLTHNSANSRHLISYPRPSMYDAIAYHGTSCHLFFETSAKDMTSIAKGYDASSFTTDPAEIDASTKKTLEILKHPEMDFSNLKIWLDRVVPLEHLTQASAEVIGLFDAMRHPDLACSTALARESVSGWTGDQQQILHLDHLLQLLKSSKHGPYAISSLMIGPMDDVIDQNTFTRLADKIRLFCDCVQEIDPKRARFLPGALIRNALPINFGMKEIVEKWQQTAFKASFSVDDLLNGCNASQAGELSEKLDLPRLLEKAPDKVKQQLIVSSFDL